MKKIWNTYKASFILLVSMLIGGIGGVFFGERAKILQPIADMFLNLLYCCVVPLIFCSLTSAISKMKDLQKLKKIMLGFFIGTVVTGVIACVFMIIPALIWEPGKGAVLNLAQEAVQTEATMNLLDMFTVNDFPLLLSKNNLMALIVFAVIFSIAIIQSGEKGAAISSLMDHLTEVMMKVIGIVMKLAPLGLGSYFAILMGQYGKELVGPFSRALIIYLVVVVLYYVIALTAMAYLSAGMQGVKVFWKGAAAPSLTALGTCSSAATLPVNLLHAQEIGIPEEIADVVIPLGANLHKDGACIMQVLKISLLCSVFGIPFATPHNLMMAIIVSLISAMIIGGVPGGGYVAEIFIISIFGFPTVAIPIMILIGTITDAPATAINVTGDTGLAMVIARMVEGKDWMKKA